MRGPRTGTLRGAAVVAAAALVWLPAGPGRGETTSGLRVELAGAPQWVHGSDGRQHVEYDLVVTNGFPAAATLRSLVMRGGGRSLLSLRGPALGAVTSRLSTAPPGDLRLSPGSSTLTQVDLVLPRSSGRRAPARLVNRVRYAVPTDSPLRSVLGSPSVRVAARVARRPPVVIA